MLREEAAAEFAYIRVLWPDAKFEDGLAGFWIKQIAKHDSPAEFRDAVEKHRAKCKYSKPNLAEIEELLARKTPASIEADGPAHTGVYVQCIEGPKAGTYQQLLYATDVQPPPSHVISRIAQDEARKYAAYWGGRCIVVEHASPLEMLKRRAELQVRNPPSPFARRDESSWHGGRRHELGADDCEA